MSHYECLLDSLSLSSLDESICILDICEDAPKMRITALPLLGGGQKVLHQMRESLAVHIRFAIHETEPVHRREIAHRVLAWAEKGGLLEISPRPGQHLRVVCTEIPALHTEDWTETLQFTFTSAADPFWEGSEVSQYNLAESTYVKLPGNATAVPDAVMVINNSASPVTTLTLTFGDTCMTFDGIHLPAGNMFNLWQSRGMVHARIDEENVLRYRTPDSDDLLLLPCGQDCRISVTADQPVDAAMAVRGRYL